MAFVYKPSAFMLPDSHYDKEKADRAVAFIEHLCHTKGKWAGKPFLLLPWQEQIVRDLFGIVKKNGKRQFLTAYIEIPKKNGKSELAAAIALYLLYADNEPSAEVYGAACDRNQASIVFDVARQMVEMSPALMRRSKIRSAGKRIINYRNAGFYQVLSAETGTKHGLNVSGLVFDEIHAQPNRKLYDVLTKGSGDAREQPLFFIITTAGNDKNSICYELHTKVLDLVAGRKKDSTFYPVVYGLEHEEDWTDEANWYKANPSLGHTIQIDRVREAYRNAVENPAEENVFKQLRLNIWTSASIRWIPEQVYDKGNLPIDLDSLWGRMCYGGLDLSSTSDITALVLAFPPRSEDEKYILRPFFWLPEDTLEVRCRRDHVLYDVWKKQGFIQTTEGNVIHYGFIEKFIEKLGETYHIREIAYDRWNATQMVQNLEDRGFTMVPFGQGFKDMSPPSKELFKLLMEGNIIHGGNPVLKWMMFQDGLRALLRQDPDILVVGEIRDGETARIAVRAALTGHVIFSTLHAPSAVEAVIRLTDMGVAPYLAADALAGVVSQRLVRCRRSDGSYQGRFCLCEVVPAGRRLRDAIRRCAGVRDLTDAARSDGAVLLPDVIARTLAAGRTDEREIRRVCEGGSSW